MSDRTPLTIEVLGGADKAHPVVLDRVIGGTVYLDEAKRIGHRLLEIANGDIPPQGFRILSPEQEVLYQWYIGSNETTNGHAR